MAAGKTMPLPVIDLSGLKEGTRRWDSVKRQVRTALEEYGCFQAVYGEIPQSLQKSVTEGMQQLFDLPLEIKKRNRSDIVYHGYIGQIPYIPLFESIVIDDVLTIEKVQNFTNGFLSQLDPTFSKNIHSLSEKLSELEKKVKRMVLESFDLEKYMDEQMNSTNYVLRVQKYNAPRSNEDKVGLLPHTDRNLMSILCPTEVPGLEVLTKDEQWVQLDPSPDYFTVIAGDCFYAWTNGRLHSVEHRVIMKEDVERYSMGLFSNPKDGYMIKAPEEMVDEDHPLLFNPYEYSKFMDFYTSKSHQKSLPALKEYCGAY